MEPTPTSHSRPFAGTAGEYARGRPDYPPELIRWALPAPVNVVDLAAGAGQLTRGLLAQGHRVIAIEPVEQMLAELLRASPTALGVRAVGEAIPLRSGSTDAVTVGQAFHWLDPARALPEIARVLRPSGTLTVAYNVLDYSVPWVRRFSDLIGGGRDALPDSLDELEAHPAFAPTRRTMYRHWQPLELPRFVDLVMSYSFVARLTDEQRADLAVAVTDFFRTTAPGSTLRLPYRSHAVQAVVDKPDEPARR